MDSTNVAAGLSIEVDRLRARVAELERERDGLTSLLLQERDEPHPMLPGKMWIAYYSLPGETFPTHFETRELAVAGIRKAAGLAAIDGAGVATGGPDGSPD